MRWPALLLGLLVCASAGGEGVRPGLLITPDNYRQYLADLRRLLSPGAFRVVEEGLRRGYIKMPIVETKRYPQYRPFYEATLAHRGRARVGPDNQLLGWVSGLPFPQPRRGVELAWNLDRRVTVSDNYFFEGDFYLYNGPGRPERRYRWWYWVYRANGRVWPPPVPLDPINRGRPWREQIRWRSQFVMVSPFDVRGFAVIRTRYEGVDRWDDLFSYIPAIRRIRRMTGADVCDPMLGTDTIYDDFELFSQKITARMTFRMHRKRMLVPIYYCETPPAFDPKTGYRQHVWNLREGWVLEIFPNDPEYLYSKRVVYLEAQRLNGSGYYLDTYDQRGRLYRQQVYLNRYLDDELHTPSSFGARYTNLMSGHFTHIVMEYPGLRVGRHREVRISAADFNFRWLLRHAR